MRARRAVSFAAVGFFVTVSVFAGVVMPANASVLWPAGFNPKQLMIDVLSSVLAGAGPSSPSKRAVIAADQKYDHSWEALEEQWKTPGGAGAPQNYQDYALQEQEYFAKNNLTSKQGDLATAGNSKKYIRKATIPATKAAQWTKTAAGVVGPIVVVAGFSHRADIADGVASIVGVDDATGAVCQNSSMLAANGASAIAGFQNFVTGRDCNAWKQAQDYRQNLDVVPGFSSGEACSTDGTQCIKLTGVATYLSTTGKTYGLTCFVTTKGAAAGSFTWAILKSGKVQAGNQADGAAIWTNGNFPYSACVAPVGGFGAAWRDPGNVDAIAGISNLTAKPADSAFVPVTAADSDPGRTMTCEIVGTDGKTYSASSPVFKESTGVMGTPVCPVLPGGVTAANVKAQETTPGAPPSPIVDQPTTPEYQAWWNAYPECHNGACPLDLVRKDSQASCFEDLATAALCADWMKDPNKSTNYQCTYGVHDVSISECFAYGDVFKPDKVTAGQAYSDPLTGASVSGQSSPTAAQNALLRGFADPQDYTGCLDHGWAAANPVEWVMVPVQCALQWAFAPPPTAFSDVATHIQGAWEATTVGQVGVTLSSFNVAATSSGCRGPAVDIPPYMNGTTFPFDACSGPKALMAGATNTISLVAFSISALWAVVNACGAIFGWSYKGASS